MAGRAQTEQTRLRARAKFLKVLAQCANVSEAVAAARVGRATVYEWRAADETFAAAWDEALETAIDALEREMWRRGVEGVEKPLIGRVGKDQDGIITTVREYSDSLISLLAKAHRPEKYRERHEIDHRGKLEVEYVNNWRETD